MKQLNSNSTHTARKLGILLAMALVLLMALSQPLHLQAQSDDAADFPELTETKLPTARGAFLRSLLVPGWGHYYVDNQNWTRGKWQLGTDIALLISYFGFRNRAQNLQDEVYTFARLYSGTDVEGRTRDYLLAVTNYDDLQTYNDAQARSRNWNNFITDTPANQWAWQSEDRRLEFSDLRDRQELLESQLPGIIGLMVVNRLVAAISASRQANRKREEVLQLSFGKPAIAPAGYQATVRLTFGR